MTYQEFSDELSSRISPLLDDNITLNFKEVKKNNDVTLHGLTFIDRNTNISPTVYLDYFFDKYQNDPLYTLDVICDEIVTQYRKYAPQEDFDVSVFTDFSKAKNLINYRLINYEQNRKLLEDIPYIKFLDLAIVFYCIIETEYTGQGSILIRNEHIDLWNKTSEELLKIAKKNTPVQNHSLIYPIADVLSDYARNSGIPVEELPLEDQPGIYVLSNEMNLFGACCILYKNLLDSFSEKINSDLIIIPSSVHEVLLLQDTNDYDPDMLCELINHVNNTTLDREDVLSDHAYYYRRDTKMITC